MILNPIAIATQGYVPNSYPLSVASRGYIDFGEIVDDATCPGLYKGLYLGIYANIYGCK